MRAYDIIKHKRDGKALAPESIRAFLNGYLAGEVPDYQMAALLMAVFFRGLTPDELNAWTDCMLRSGTVLDLSDIPGAKIDKHSTGGVGDKISLPLAALVASCGVKVPMISGRGLGHTGGTLDKLESIPGFETDLSIDRFRKQLADIGVSMIGQTSSLAPLDRRLYALRDVIAAVESLPLIASSIMSKKLAAGIDGLVLDVKVGSGAFMKNVDEARALAETMVAIGARMNKRVVAVLTDMNQPLGRAVGNSLEVEESLAVLNGEGPDDVVELTMVLGAQMLVLGGIAASTAEARPLLREAIERGRACATFETMVLAQGGDPAVVRDPRRLPRAAQRDEITAARAGYLQSIDTEQVGIAAMQLGAGRTRVDSPIDPAVGLTVQARLGEQIEKGQTLVVMHSNPGSNKDKARALLQDAFRVGPEPPPPAPLILEVVAPQGARE